MTTWVVRDRCQQPRPPQPGRGLTGPEYKRWLRVVVTDVPEGVIEQRVKDALTGAGFDFGVGGDPECDIELRRAEHDPAIGELLDHQRWDAQFTWTELLHKKGRVQP